jgi:DNA polymerase (family X)
VVFLFKYIWISSFFCDFVNSKYALTLHKKKFEMGNSDIGDILELTSKLLDLHDKDEIRSKTYASAVFNISRITEPLSAMSKTELIGLRGIGKLLANNIEEICTTGSLQELKDLMEQTPEGVFDIFKVKGLGVKKIKLLWKNLGIDNINDLRIACENNSIASEKGFGLKTQEAIIASLDFLKQQTGKLRMDSAQMLSATILDLLKLTYPDALEVGTVPRRLEIAEVLQFAIIKDGFGGIRMEHPDFEQDIKESSPGKWVGKFQKFAIPIEIIKVTSNDKLKSVLILNANEEHFKFQNASGISFYQHLQGFQPISESDAYTTFGYNYIVPEMREGMSEFEWSKNNKIEDLIDWKKLSGTLHNHSTYSDGSHTLSQMANYAKEIGLTYFGIADHSQSAQYAHGLFPETVRKQHEEINTLNAGFNDFKIYKGIESDILLNGNLDYENDVLASFDYVVASVHSVLNMDLEKATARLIKAIENPFTSILGHLSGRLLLSRNGYPLDYPKIIDACAANKVSMELNASPYRLDIDWRWIPLCLEKGVLISINPDAHEMHGLHDMHYGTQVARKAGLTGDMTLNALPSLQLEAFFRKK